MKNVQKTEWNIKIMLQKKHNGFTRTCVADITMLNPILPEFLQLQLQTKADS